VEKKTHRGKITRDNGKISGGGGGGGDDNAL